MKKALSTALILGTLYGTANAAPITSPIYMPESGKFLMQADFGYSLSQYSKKLDEEFGKDVDKGFNIGLDGKVGILDRLSLNYGANFSFAREIYNTDVSAQFDGFYLGATGRVIDIDMHKFDITLNLGQDGSYQTVLKKRPFVDLSLRYGLELNRYNLGLSLDAKYSGKNKVENVEKTGGNVSLGITLENEIIFMDNLTMGVDLFYRYNTKINYSGAGEEGDKDPAYNKYGIALDINYGFTENLFLGAYAGFTFNDTKDKNVYEDGGVTTVEQTENIYDYNFGLRLTSRF